MIRGQSPIVSALILALLGIFAPSQTRGQVVAYECDAIPPEAGWTPGNEFCGAQQWIEDGILVQDVDLCFDFDPPVGQVFDYTQSLGDFGEESQFFYEVRMRAEGGAGEFVGAGPANFSLGSSGTTKYLFRVAEDIIRLTRDLDLPIIFVPIEPGVMHTHRVESYGDELYIWYIDGEVVDSGVPEGTYPAGNSNPKTNMGARSVFTENMVWWDYIRWGRMPDDASGDYDSSETVDLADWYFVTDCLTKNGPGIYGGPGGPCPDGDDTCEAVGEITAGPGCTFADFDEDNDVDLRDVAAFVSAFTGTK